MRVQFSRRAGPPAGSFTGLSLFDTDSSSDIASQTPAEAWVTWPGWPLVSPDGTLAAMADVGGLMTIYDTQSLAALRSFEAGVPIGGFSPDGSSIVVAPRVEDGPVPDDARPGTDPRSGRVSRDAVAAGRHGVSPGAVRVAPR